MAKALLVHFRQPEDLPLEPLVELLNRRLCPDNITPRPPIFRQAGNTALAVFNPNDTVEVHGTSACLGAMFEPDAPWWQTGTIAPDGSYAIFRAGERSGVFSIELLTDILATRTIWYVLTPQFFAASTSQRALIALLGSYEPNPQAVSWMLSTGVIGPGQSWDHRIQMLPGDSRLRFDPATWQINLDTAPVEYTSENHRPEKQYRQVKDSLARVIGGLEIDYSRWRMLLSGGIDSRAILLNLPRGDGLQCITWGMRSAMQVKESDAYIAAELARSLKVPHCYMVTDLHREADVDVIFDRFLTAGEGRVDQVRGYMDGFQIWQQLVEDGVQGIIRGDECFGSPPPYSTAYILRQMNALTLDDYQNGKKFTGDFGLPANRLPSGLRKRRGEDPRNWSTRMVAQHLIPHELAALNEIKSSFVEVMNPLLSRELVMLSRSLSPAARTGRVLYDQVVLDAHPGLSYATANAVEEVQDLLKKTAVVQTVLDTLASDNARAALPEEMLGYLRNKVQPRGSSGNGNGAKKRKYKQMLPRWLRSFVRDHFSKPNLDSHKAAFRAYIITRMHGILQEDARLVEEMRETVYLF